MNWILYAVAAAFFLALADILVKTAAGRLPNSLALLLYGSIPFVTGLLWTLVDKSRGIAMSTPPRILAVALGVGISFTLVTISLYAAFRSGAPLSLASPLIRLGGLLVASLVGVLVWKELIGARYLLGLGLSLAGIYLMVTR